MRGYKYIGWFICSLLVGCAKTTATMASVEVVDLAPHARYGESYTVKPGDSLYYIAWHYGLDYKSLAAINHIAPPYTLSVGQTLHLVGAGSSKKVATRPNQPSAVTAKTSVAKTTSIKMPAAASLHWQWPVPPNDIKRDAKKAYLHRGIDIAAHQGQVVQAAESGVVAYTGKGIQDFGTLIIINHSHDYLTAYAYNDKVLVKEGQTVVKGQKIASVGKPPVGVTRLHFEMRKHGKPINPLQHLPKA